MIYLDEVLQGAKTVGITGHIRPDGDCVGSTLGVYNYIRENMPQIDVDIYLQPIMDEFMFLKNSDKITDRLLRAGYTMYLLCAIVRLMTGSKTSVCTLKMPKRRLCMTII